MKKRSILAATAMLLVAILAATGATYAWFQSKDQARTDISMKVATASSLEISKDNVNWVSYLDNTSFNLDDTKVWSDRSAADAAQEAAALTFYSEVYYSDPEIAATPSLAGQIKEYQELAPVKTTVYFRSTKNDAIKLTGSTIDSDTNDIIKPHLRVAFGKQIMSSVGGSINSAIKDTAGTTGAQTWTAINDTEFTPWGQQNGDGFYYGQVDIYYWVEGTTCTNAMAYGDAAVAFVFSQM